MIVLRPAAAMVAGDGAEGLAASGGLKEGKAAWWISDLE